MGTQLQQSAPLKNLWATLSTTSSLEEAQQAFVLAVRLTGNPKVHASVLEASKDRKGGILASVPALFTKLLGNPEYH